ncbi:MAG: nucleotide exchange factor GrpE [Candidatus Omnitrophica bacterium]|nr:nucleotide exchange factor GrpE [Candidatus Omnitrophota bacterium]
MEDQEKTPESIEIARVEYEELLKKANEFSELQDRLLRSAADFDNARKRLAKEREEFIKFALEDLIHDLLPVLDHFELALSHLQVQDEKSKSVRDGFLLIQKQLFQTLTERGLRRIETLGKAFDPYRHEAVGHVESQQKPEGIILEEALAGYELNGKLLRPAKVKTSIKEKKGSEEKAEELT